MTENMKAVGPFDISELEHVLRDGGRQVVGVGLVTVGVTAQVWCDKPIAVRAGVEEWHELAVVLRPPMKAKNCGATAHGDVMEIHAIHARPFVRRLHHCQLAKASRRGEPRSEERRVGK